MRWYILPLLFLVGCATPESGTSTNVPAPVVNVINNFGAGHTIAQNDHTNAQAPGISTETTQEARGGGADPDAVGDGVKKVGEGVSDVVNPAPDLVVPD